jgi:hypothetical protein
LVSSPYLVIMNVQIDQLVKSLLQKESLEHCSLQEVEQFAERHPHFGAAQLLLTKKLQVENSDKFNEQLQKTLLFFHNPLWVEHLLNETGNAVIRTAEKKNSIAVTEPVPAAIAEPEIRNTFVETPLLTEEENDMTETATSIEPAMEIAALKIEPIDPATAELSFEPFHTVDYFASQGIKFREEAKPQDKFGKQLKSFTDWLKTMKRFPGADAVKPVEATAEKKVEQLAEHSIESREVITESMAEVWEKQGNAAKAIEIYSKLSLLEPSKSRYFAAKIEELKKLN